MINLDYGKSADSSLGNVFKVSVIPDSAPQFEDRDKVRSIHGRMGRYMTDPVRKVDILTHWEIPPEQVRDLLLKWQEDQIVASNPAKERIEYFKSLSTPIKACSRIPDEEVVYSKPPLPHQKQYVQIDRSKNRLLLSWKVGLGKTLGAIERARVLSFKKLLIVCPKKTVTNWASEFSEINYPYKVTCYRGSVKERTALLAALNTSDVVITSFEMADEVSHLSYDQIIVDEAHLVSRLTAQRTQSIKNIIERNAGSGLQLLTGTPIMHRIPDLWTLVHMLCPELAGSEVAWIDRYVRNGEMRQRRMPNGKMALYAPDRSLQNTEELKERLESIMVRIGYEGITDFADSQEIITVDMTPRQRRIYNRIREDILLEIGDKTLSLQSALVRMLRLLQCSEGLFNLDPTWKDSGKMDYICQELDNTDEKVIIWSRFQPLTNLLYEKYKDRSVLFNGSVSPRRQDLGVWSFQGVSNPHEAELFEKYRLDNNKSKTSPRWEMNPGEAQFFFGVVDPRSSLGINLHQNCSRQIFSSFHWNGNAMMQAKGRLTRYGQMSKEVRTDYLVAVDTFEKAALTFILKNYQSTLEILDGKADKSHQSMSELVRILRRAA